MQLIKKYSRHLPIIILTLFSIALFAVSVRIATSRYVNFENGKFDLGNMAQMVHNTMNGRFMQLTDYFGTNMPRWGMSHVDPLLLIFIPFMAIFKTPLVLVYGQLFLIIIGAFFLFKIAELELRSSYAALAISLAYLFYPAIGFIMAWTDYHGVTAAMPFFFAAFYIFEKMHKTGNFSRKGRILLWIALVLNMAGKEEIPIFVALFGLFVLLFRTDLTVLFDKTREFRPRLADFFKFPQVKIAFSMMIVGTVWFIVAFFVLIPSASHYRVDGYVDFLESIDLEPEDTNSLQQENYFLRRYEEFGDTYLEVVFGMLTHPSQVMEAWIDGSKPIYFRRTFDPILFFPLLAPSVLMIAIPEFIINYTSTSGGVSTANIENHRISMIIVILFIASVYGISFVTKLVDQYLGGFFAKLKIRKVHIALLLSFLFLGANIKKTFEYENFVYMWVKQAIERRILPYASAEENVIKDERAFKEDLQVGESMKLVRLETKDRDCAQFIVDMVPEEASVTGPDYMGAKLSLRETYALFPALYHKADYVIADVYARKVSRVLGVPSIIVNSSMGKVIMDPNYQTKFVCGNLAVFERGGPYEKSDILPIQQTFTYNPTIDAEIYRGLYLRDFNLPSELNFGEFVTVPFVYERKDIASLDAHKLFLTFVHKETAGYFQVPNLPSYSIFPLKDWKKNRFYIENVDIMLPEFLDDGVYRVFMGMTDGISTQSIYLGETLLK